MLSFLSYTFRVRHFEEYNLRTTMERFLMSKKMAVLSTTGRQMDWGLLVLRIVTGTTLVIKHGWEKVSDFHTMATNTRLPFPNLFHLGTTGTLVVALVSDFGCGMLVMLGFGTRVASIFAFLNILVAFIWVHHMTFLGRSGDHGEIIVLFLGAFAALVLTGPGRYSVDGLIANRDR